MSDDFAAWFQHSVAFVEQATELVVRQIGVEAACQADFIDCGVTPGNQAAVQMAGWIDTLGASLKHSEEVLTRAERYGMEVSEAQAKLTDGREDLVKARLAMHSFHPEEMQKPIEAGMAIAGETLYIDHGYHLWADDA